MEKDQEIKYVYKIISDEALQIAKIEKNFKGEGIDITDSFIHMSYEEQVSQTLDRFFKGREDLYLLKINPLSLDNLKVEDTSGHGKFPHLYSTFDILDDKKVIKISQLKLNGENFDLKNVF